MDKISEGFRGYVQEQPLIALILLGVLAVLIASMIIIQPYLTQRRKRTPFNLGLFKQFCHENQLTRTEIRSIKKIARAQDLDPNILLVRRSFFESGLTTIHVNPAIVESLRTKLYGT